MNHLTTGLLVSVLFALVVAIVWLTGRNNRGTLAKSIERGARHWMIILFAGAGLLLSAPAAMAHDYIEPTSDGVAVVTCELNDRDPVEVMERLAKHDPHLFDEWGEGCHKVPTGVSQTIMPLSPQSCNLFSTPTKASNCFDASTKTFAIFDPLNPEQRRETTQVWLDDKQVETIYIDRTHPAELLIMAAPKARSYTYSLKFASDYRASYCPVAHQDRSWDGTIDVENHSFFVVTIESCVSRDPTAVWLEDWSPLLN